MKIAYLGPESSFTHTAATKAFPNEELVPYHSIPACIKAVEFHEVDLSIVPIENTLEGSVNMTVDYLFHQSTIPVGAELVLPIYQQFMVRKEHRENWQNVSKILSHPQALAQSQGFLSTHFPEVPLEQTPSTAYAANFVSEHTEENYAAIAPKTAAETYDLAIVKENIQDTEVNHTKFWVLGEKNLHLSHLTVQKRQMSIAITMPNNIPGSLYKALSVFSWRGIDLSKIESRPLKTSLGEYFFLIDLVIEQPKELIEFALQEIKLLGGEVKLFGNYDVFRVEGV